MLPRKIFENLHTVVAILVLFKQFLGKFFAPNLSFTEYDACCGYIFDCACIGRKAYCYRKDLK